MVEKGFFHFFDVILVVRKLTSKSIILFLILVLFYLTGGCTKIPEIDYEDLTAEELEILYNNGKHFLLPNLCKAYAKWYLETLDKEWWLYGLEYKKEAGLKLKKYCNESFKKGKNKAAACYLEAYYRDLLNEGNLKIGKFIVFSRECRDAEFHRRFVNNDSMVLATVEHAMDMLKYLSEAKSFESAKKRLKITISLFDLYVKNLKQLRDKTILLLEQMGEVIEIFEDTSIVMTQLQNSYNNAMWADSDTAREMIRFHFIVQNLIQNFKQFTRLEREITKRLSNIEYFRTAGYPSFVVEVVQKLMAKEKNILNDYSLHFQEIKG